MMKGMKTLLGPAPPKGPKVKTAAFSNPDATPRAPKTEGMERGSERRMMAESALHTLTRAEEHKKDKSLMRDVKMVAKETMRSMESAMGKKA